jgi:hypothetical protein
MSFLNGWKTYIVAAVFVIIAIKTVLEGSPEGIDFLWELLQNEEFLTGAGLAALRHGISG